MSGHRPRGERIPARDRRRERRAEGLPHPVRVGQRARGVGRVEPASSETRRRRGRCGRRIAATAKTISPIRQRFAATATCTTASSRRSRTARWSDSGGAERALDARRTPRCWPRSSPKAPADLPRGSQQRLRRGHADLTCGEIERQAPVSACLRSPGRAVAVSHGAWLPCVRRPLSIGASRCAGGWPALRPARAVAGIPIASFPTYPLSFATKYPLTSIGSPCARCSLT